MSPDVATPTRTAALTRRAGLGLLVLGPTLAGAVLMSGVSMHTAWAPEEAAAPAPAGDAAAWVDARRAAGQASTQAGFLITGSAELASGAAELNARAEELQPGITQLADGAKQLNQGLVELQAGTGQLGDGAVKVADGVDGAVEKVQGLVAVQMQVISAVDNIDKQLEKSTDPRAPQWRKQLADLRAEAAKLGINGDMVDQLAELRSGTRELANQLAVPGYAYHDGIYQAAEGTKQLVAGTTQLDEGTAAALEGIAQLAEGAAKVDQMAQRTRDDAAAVTRAMPAVTTAEEPDTPTRSLAPLIAFLLAAAVCVGAAARFGWGTLGVAAIGIAALFAIGSGLDSTGLALAAIVIVLTTVTAGLVGRVLGRGAMYASLLVQTAITGHVWAAAAGADVAGWKHTLATLMPLNYAVDALVAVGNSGSTQHIAISCGVLAATAVLALIAGRFVTTRDESASDTTAVASAS
ncbi:hypothetical protein C1Y63_02215 [Corynebacterium sp. 13CS0277]|uniref:hypothetical protein n=1 Tax=Corynebacterium sp. 13CS0277 TaxID=2071994 RepID=UPI000D039797|nr:hypothetical protein [Corynebacterium sp. 13CS0277]PRQ12148.1 hypothetical protein C1Y63_02215 [Corynebacterium sp. 13CS0277]